MINNKTKKRQFIRVYDHNPCPQCGSKVYGVITSDNIYYVGCRRCGAEHEVQIPFCIEDPYGTFRLARMQWNGMFLHSKFSEKTLSVMGIHDGDYLVVDRFEENIVFVAKDTIQLDNFLLDRREDEFFDLYRVDKGGLVHQN